MSMNTPGRPRLRGFKAALYLSIAVSVVLQLWTGSKNPAFVLILPAIVFLAYMVPAIMRARRERRASGAPRTRVIYPLAFKLAAVGVLLGGAVAFVLLFTQKGQAVVGEHAGLRNAVEGAMALSALALAQWQRSIIRGQLGSDWSGQSGLTSSNATRGRRWS
jgi:hypothetical protein